jgi:mRNA interferase RelE/StbE
VTYRVELTALAREASVHLPPAIKRQVKEAIRFLSQNPHGGEPLKHELAGKWKLRVGRFRIVYRLEESRRVVVVIAVGPRKNIYSSL